MDILSRLQSEFGDAVSSRPASEKDAVDGVQPQAVAAPRDEEAAQALVHFCGRENVAFVPRGGGTKLHIGAPPSRCDLIISTENLTQIFDHDEGNATVQAGAGISIDVLDTEMRKRGQFVTLPSRFHNSTLGGVVATNDFGPDKLKFGAPRDLVTGLHAVLSDGRLVKAGSKVVKNVSGYDLNKLFIGSFGNLGLITNVTTRLRPVSEELDFKEYQCANREEAISQAWEISNGDFNPTFIFLWTYSKSSNYFVRVGFEGSKAEVESQIKRLPQFEKLHPFGERKGQWNIVARLPRRNAQQWFLLVQQTGTEAIYWNTSLGVVETYFNQPELSIHKLRAEAEKLGGFLIVEKAPNEVKTPELVWGKPRGDFALMKKLKQSFDGANVCAPGRFIGGL